MLRKKGSGEEQSPAGDKSSPSDQDPSGKSKAVVDPPKPTFSEAIAGAKNILSQGENRPVIMKLVYTTLAMLVLPVITFYMVYNINRYTSFELTESLRSLYGGVAAVLVVQAIIVSYVVMGLMEKDERSEPEKNKKQ